MQIADIRATPVSVPLEAPLRHANGCHWGRFVRTIVEVETDTGLVGLGELGGGGESAEQAAIRRGLQETFVKNIAFLFYYHFEPKHPDKYRPELDTDQMRELKAKTGS